jgi:polyisoprenoid-binding protein YceI
MTFVRSLFALTLTAWLATCATAETFDLTGENTKVEFVGAKKDGTHPGGFKKLSGTATVKEADPATLALSVTIDTDSLYSDDPKLTAQLKSPDFFEVKRFPEAKFVTTEIAKKDKGYTISGKLTLHGKTAEVTFPADVAVTKEGFKLSAKFAIDRNDWGISYGKGMIDDEVQLSIAVAAKK